MNKQSTVPNEKPFTLFFIGITVFVIFTAIFWSVSFASAEETPAGDSEVLFAQNADGTTQEDNQAQADVEQVQANEPAGSNSDITDPGVQDVAEVPATETVAPAEGPIQQPALATDKPDYSPTETASIFGKFFQALQNIVLKIFGYDENGTNSSQFTDTITTDQNGEFAYNYQLDGTYRPNYTITASTPSDEQLAQTTFTDANIGYDKSGYDKGTATWGPGNQGGYEENDWVQYQYTITGVTTLVPNLNVIFDEQVGGRIFIDGFSNFRYIIDAPYVTGNSVLPNGTSRPPSTDTGGWNAFKPMNINYTHSGGTCNTIDASNTPSAEHCFRIDPTDGSWSSGDRNGFPTSFVTGTHSITIFYEAHMAATFVWSTGHESLLGDNLSIYGVHAPSAAVPSGVSFGTSIYTGWTTTAYNGAGGGGSNKHFNIADQSAGSQGAITLPIPAVTLPTGSVTIIKVTNPTTAMGITFLFISDFGPFILDTDASTTHSNTITFGSLPAGTFNFAEVLPAPSGWSLKSILCQTTGGITGSTFATSTVTGTSTVSLVSGGLVTCTYVNSINQVTPTVTTAIHNVAHQTVTSVSVGATVHDSTTVTGSNGTATGNVIFDWYLNGTCNGSPVATSTTFPLSGGAADATTFTQGPLNAGDYSFKAHYAGDSNYFAADSLCEPLSVTKLSPSISTTPSSGGVVGIAINDSATVAGGSSPTGTVTFNLYGPTDSTCSNSALFTDTKNLSSGTAVSGNYTTLAAGTFHWKATYNGDTNNNATTSPCADEAVTITKASPSISTEIHNSSEVATTSAPAGTTVHDKATLSGGYSPTGNVTFTFFNNGNCTPTGSSAGTIALSAGVAHPSSSEGPLNAGSYSFKAHYNGDGNNNEAESDCEPLAITKLTPTVVTEIHNASESATTSVSLGATVHDQATVSGSYGTPSGNITFTFFNNGTCSPTGSAAGTVALISGVAHPSASQGPLAVGSYSFKAHYEGDSNYLTADSDCEPLTVNKADTTTVTEVHDQSHQDITNTSVAVGTSIHDSASVGTQVDNMPITGNIIYSFFATGNCIGEPEDQTVILGQESSAKNPDPGAYSFQAFYSGDNNYNGSTGACEPISIVNARIKIDNTATNAVGVQHTFIVTVEKNTGSGWVGISGNKPAVSFDPATPGSVTDNCNSTGTDGSGQCSVIVNSTVAGIFTANATSSVNVNDVIFNLATNNIAPNSGPAVKTYVDANISLTPGVATNSIGDIHTLTAHVNVNPGTGFVNAPNGTSINVSVVSGPGSLTPANGICTTAGDTGSCTVTLSSLTPGDTVLNASTLVTVGGIPLTRATGDSNAGDGADAVKHWVAGSLEVTKIVNLGFVVNPTAISKDFVVTVTGPSYLTGHDITFHLVNGVLQAPASTTLFNLIPGNYTITEADAGTSWTETVPASPVAVVANQTAQAEVTNVFVPGSLEITKALDLKAYYFSGSLTTSFTVTVNGPSYPASTTLTFNVVNGVLTDSPQTLYNLIPGTYKVAESDPGIAWTVSNMTGNVNVEPYTPTLRTITNTIKLPNTLASLSSNVQETTANGNVILTISDINNGEVPLTAEHMHVYLNNIEATGSPVFSPLTKTSLSFVGGDTGNDGIMGVGETWTWVVTISINTETTFRIVGHSTDPLGNPVDGDNGYPSEVKLLTIKVIGATRTLGFWQTHTGFTTYIFNLPVMQKFVGVNIWPTSTSHKGIITATSTPGGSQLFGGFYAPIAKKTTGVKREQTDQARIQMLQQLLAAKLNCAAFGCSSSIVTLISNADAAFASGNKSQINSLAGQLDAYNNSNDSIAIPSSLLPTGKATPKTSQSYANLVFWDLP